MKQIAYIVLVGGMVTAGCLPSSFFRDDKKPPQVEITSKAPPVVTADSVTEQNATERAAALRAELEHDLAQRGQVIEKTP